ncbi:MAG: hypothetical protein ACLFV7_09555 [Phycisphaerae bacterium]
MWELIVAAFAPANVVFTVLLILVLLYWVCVILGALDLDFLDVDIVDADADVDMDVDADVEAGGDVDVGWLRTLLLFFYVGDMPVMIIFSLAILSAWVFSMFANQWLNPGGGWGMALVLVVPNLLVTAVVVKIVGKPFAKLFSMMNEDKNAPRKVMGRLCRVITTTVTADALGQAEMEGTGAPLLLNVRTERGETLHRGDEAVVIGQDKATGVYIVAPVDMES